MRVGSLDVPMERIESFCRKWRIIELSLFGSALRKDFDRDSDVDVLVSLEPGHVLTPESFLDMRDELISVFGGREVDLVQKRLLKNPFRRHEILNTREIIYAA